MGDNDIRAMPSARSGELRSEPVPVSAVPAPATIAVTQADREAAAAYMDRVKSTRWSIEGILSGGCDNTSIVQAFARHRTEAQAKLREALERAERRLRKHRDDTPADDTRDKAKAYAIVFTALRDTQP